MICPECQSNDSVDWHFRSGEQEFICRNCGWHDYE